jgi:3-oxoacyl-[acyl-carrier protein] reductase
VAVSLLDGRCAVVTGAARGIGLEIARRLAEEGAALVLADLNSEGVEEAAAELRRSGHRACGQVCDVTKEGDVDALFERAKKEYGVVYIAVNNAGVTRDATLAKMTVDDFRTVVDTNLLGCWLGTKVAAAAMRDSGGGTITNISSMSGKVGLFGQTNYSAAKAGIIGLTKAAAKELARFEIRVNAVQPGLIRTPMTEALGAETLAQRLTEIPLSRIGEPRDVANAVLFLSSDLSSYMTGGVLEVAGGRYM